MAFMHANPQHSFSEVERNGSKRDSQSPAPMISSELRLKSSSHQAASAKALDKDVVLKRIRHHKTLNKVRSAFHSLVGGAEQENTAVLARQQQQKWLDPDDTFSFP